MWPYQSPTDNQWNASRARCSARRRALGQFVLSQRMEPPRDPPEPVLLMTATGLLAEDLLVPRAELPDRHPLQRR